MMRTLLQRGALVLGAALGLVTVPSAARAQKALVYCPVSVDATGCTAIVNALTGPSYPLGVDRGYDGTGGTVDLKTVDLFTYSVFVVPSLADGTTSQPYAKLRDAEVVEHLKAALIGRIAMWSGSPDQGATNRAMKDALIQNLAGWAGGAFGMAKGPGLVALLDASATVGARYDWVRAITPVPVTSDPALLIYNGVRALGPRATAILTSGAGPVVYDNMATFGFQVPNGAAGVSLDAVGQTGTTQGGQVVLLTMDAGNSTGALVQTDRYDYAPYETVTITGSGWQAGEQVKLSLHMDPLRDSDTELTATADGNGAFVNTDFAPAEYDVGVRFVLTATGTASGRRAQTTFTDSRIITNATLNGATAVTVSGSESITAVVNVTTDNSGGNSNWRSTGWRIDTTAPGTVTCFNNVDHDGAGSYVETFTITAPIAASTYNAYFVAYSDNTCTNQASNTFVRPNGVVVVDAPTITTISPNTKAYGDGGFTLTVNGTNLTATSVVRFNGSDRVTTFVSATQLTASVLASDLLAVGGFPITVRNGASVISNAVTLTVTPKTITGSFTASNKVYDGTTAATILTRTLTGVIGGDVVNLTGGTATFADKTVGAAKTVTGTGFTLTGAQASRYVLASTTLTTTADITVATVLGTFTAANKIYDGATTATIATRTLTGVVSPDVVTLTGGIATFANKNVGVGKTVTGTGFTLGGADAANYALASGTLTTTADIAAKTLAVTGTGVNKIYDGTTAATVTLADDRIAGDVFTTTFTSATFADKNVGNAKPITVNGIAITGTDAGNYLPNTTCTAAADITPKSVTGTFTADNKVYDGNTNAAISARTLTGTIGGDVVSLTGGTATFDTKHVGTGKTVTGIGFTLTGADATNYALASSTPTTTANVTARALMVTANGINKIYDGTTTATVTLADNRVAGDVFTTTYASAAFADKSVGTGKPVNVSGISLSGADAGDYTFNATAATTADITPRALVVGATGINKVYDGTTAATVTLSDNRVAGDVLTTAYTTATFDTKNVGTGKTVSVSGIGLTGSDAGNYTFNVTATTTANITARAILVTATGINKVYDGLTTATVTLGDDRVGGDVFTANYATASFADKNVGVAKAVSVSGISLSGTDAGNYTPNTSAATTADITQRTLTITATGPNKVYDATTGATVTLADDRVAGDVFTDTYTSATFADKNVGTGKPISVVGIAISGTDALNYTFNTTATATANITVATVMGSFTANDKVYNGTTAATIAARNLTGGLLTDDVSLTSGSATFDTKNVGTGKTVTGTGFTLGGGDATNYVLQSTTLTTTASITARTLVVTATGVDKVYDATTAATVTLADDRVSGDLFTTAYTAAAFADKNVGIAKPVSVNGISITGGDAGNYTANTSANTTATITVATVSGSITADNKVYDGTTTATILTRTLSGVLLTDVVSLTGGTATFADKNVANGKTVTATGFALAGGDATNYVLSPTTITTTANITQKSVTGSFTADHKVYDGTTAATIATRALTGTIGGDDISLTGGAATFADKNVGTAKTVNGAGFSLGGVDTPNYSLASSSLTTTADITARAVTVTADPQTKIYGTADPALTYQVTLGTVIAGDLFTGALTRASGETVLGSPYAITQNTLTLGTNYAIAYVGANFTITPATVAGQFTASNKIYDGTTAATIATRQLTSGIVGTDDVALTGGTATFADKNAGTGKTVTATGFTLGGTTATNYVLASTTLTTTADITPRALLVSATGINKVYDATTTATVSLTDDRLGSDVLTTAYAAAAFNNKNVGTAKPVSVSGITISGTDAANYTPNTSASTTADITVFTLTGSFTADSKVYDGNNLATIASRNVAVVFAGDVVTLDGGTATFADKNVGNGKMVTGMGFGLIGADALNYVLASTTLTTTANITPRALTLTATGINKVYDGLTTATVTLADNRVSGDAFTDTYASATFADKNVGTAKPISVSGISISGTDAGNYTFNTTASAAADIAPRALAVSATGINKVYDGNATATVTLADDRVAGDVLTTAYAGAAFADKNAGTGKPVTVTGISISGTDAGNYTFNTTTTTTADITKRALAITATGTTKIYDGLTTATVTLADDRVSGDVFTDNYTTATFSDKNVGTGKTVSVSGVSITGTDAGNYNFNTTTSTTADITPRALLITAAGVNRVYDATTIATVTLTDNRVVGDVFTDTYSSASFADKNVGLAKPVSVSGISITGADAGNYTFNTTAATTANISAATLTGSFTASDKIYDGTDAAAIVTRNVAGGLLTDVVTMVSGTATFSDKNVGSNKTVTGTGFTLSGADAPNYVLASTTLTATADITPKTLVVSATGVNKVYDGNAVATVTLSDDRVSGDDITAAYAAAAFNNKNVGTAKPVSVSGITIGGADAGNYTFNNAGNTTADITPKLLTVGAAGIDKVYDGNATATVTLTDDRVAGDVLSLAYSTATFNNKSVGTNKPVSVSGISVTGADAGNYTFNATAATTANITARALLIAATGINKGYDGDANATVTLTDDRVSGDAFTTSYTAMFNDKNVGTAKPVSVTGISISGADAGNYTFNTTAATIADITPRALVVSATAQNKVYDGTTTATVTLSDDRVAGDVLTTTNTSADFSDNDVGNGKTVTVNGIAIGGADAGNYTFNTTATTTANITSRPLAVTATAQNKIYDGNTTATVVLADNRVSGDVFTASYSTALFSDKNVGPAKTVTVSGISLSGTDAGNYTQNLTTATTADITARALTVSATATNKVYDGNAMATVTLADDRVIGDALTTAYATAAFDIKNVGTGKTVSVAGITVTGVDAGNYTFNTNTTTTADITARTLVVSATGINRLYDGNATATVTLGDDRVSGDVFATSHAGASFNDKNVGAAKPVNVTGISISGLDAGNYTANTTASTTADVTARVLTVTATAANKVYDGNTTAVATLADNRVAGDVFIDAYTSATFNNANVGIAKLVSVTGISITGVDAANYTFNTSTGATADITPRLITITAAAKTKIYGDSDPMLTSAITVGTLVATGDLTGALTRAAGEDIGSYAILQGTLALTANYTLTYVGANLTITKRALSITTDNKTKIAGAANPALSGTVTGVQFTDGISAAYTTSATTLSPPGSYLIVPAIVDPNGKIGNYTVTPTSGTLAITANASPVLGTVSAPLLPTALGTAVVVSVPFTDVDVSASQPYTATIDWGNSTTSTSTFTSPGTISGTKTYAAPGVYIVTVTVKQDNFQITHFDTKTFEYYVVVYDPDGGFVTGGGWINSPVGAYYPNPSLTGKATFGFVAKYKKGQSTPDGNTEFQFHAANMNFKSGAYEWLVVAGAKAQYKGTGTIDGTGNYGFMLTAIDGQLSGGGGADKFRIKIWDKNNNDAIVYDNQIGVPDTDPPTALLGGGSINIQVK